MLSGTSATPFLKKLRQDQSQKLNWSSHTLVILTCIKVEWEITLIKISLTAIFFYAWRPELEEIEY